MTPASLFRPPATPRQTFAGDLAEVAASGRTPLCLGGKDRFTATELFENTLLGVIGRDGWAKIRDDSFDWSGSQLKDALTRFGDVVSRADPSAGALTWDQAAKKLASGDCAFLSMNDSVYGELVADGATEGKDFGYVALSRNCGRLSGDCGYLRRVGRGQDGLNSIKFLETIADPKTSLAFNKVKGSVPIRNDVDVSSLPAYQRQASEALWHDKILLSMTHGELMPSAFQQALYDAVAAFVQSKNSKSFIDTLQNSIAVPIPGGR